MEIRLLDTVNQLSDNRGARKRTAPDAGGRGRQRGNRGRASTGDHRGGSAWQSTNQGQNGPRRAACPRDSPNGATASADGERQCAPSRRPPGGLSHGAPEAELIAHCRLLRPPPERRAVGLRQVDGMALGTLVAVDVDDLYGPSLGRGRTPTTRSGQRRFRGLDVQPCLVGLPEDLDLARSGLAQCAVIGSGDEAPRAQVAAQARADNLRVQLHDNRVAHWYYLPRGRSRTPQRRLPARFRPSRPRVDCFGTKRSAPPPSRVVARYKSGTSCDASGRPGSTNVT
jgi:hypothetical protein